MLQDNKVTDLVEEEQATYASSDKLPNEIDASKSILETIHSEKEVEVVHASSENILDKTVATVSLANKPLDETLEEEMEKETKHAGSKQLPDESVASSVANDETQKENVKGRIDHLVYSDQSPKTGKVLEEIEDGKQFKDEKV